MDTESREGFRTHVARDADEHAANLTGWNQVYDQLSMGQFQGSVEELWIGKLQIFCETTSHAVRQSCRPWPRSWWFGIPLNGDGIGRMSCGRIEEDDIAVCPGGAEFELVTPDHFQILGIVMDQDEMVEYPEIAGFSPLYRSRSSRNTLRIGRDHRAQLQGVLRQVLAEVSGSPNLLKYEASRRSIRSTVLGALSDACFKAMGPERQRSTQIRHHALVSRIREYVMSNRDEPVMIADLCREFHVSRRTLQNAFHEVVGMSPVVYLRAVRLNGVRRMLRDPEQKNPCVQDAAYEWGFWHLSQFACDYRKLFGELPSNSLRQRVVQ